VRPGLVPGVNTDLVDVGEGCDRASLLGYDSAEFQMVVEYALMRHRRGEEAGAEATALSHGIDLTSWKVILSAAIVAAKEVSDGSQD
jgi:hypothetical protein